MNSDTQISNLLPPFVVEALNRADRKQIELAGAGSFAYVFKIADTGFVIKKSLDHPVAGNLQPVEKRIYERLGPHAFILRYYGEYCQGNGLPDGLVFHYHSAGTLVENLALSKYPEKRTKWPLQAAEVLQYIHSKKVIHSDIGCHNFLIQQDGSLALADFGGSVIDNTSAVVSYSTRYTRPCPVTDDSDSTEIDDIFALGTIIYEITVGHQLYPDKSSREIGKLLRKQEFPNLESIPAEVQAVIRKCWATEYHNAEEVLRDLNLPPPLLLRWPLLQFAGLSLGIAFVMLTLIRRRKRL